MHVVADIVIYADSIEVWTSLEVRHGGRLAYERDLSEYTLDGNATISVRGVGPFQMDLDAKRITLPASESPSNPCEGIRVIVGEDLRLTCDEVRVRSGDGRPVATNNIRMTLDTGDVFVYEVTGRRCAE